MNKNKSSFLNFRRHDSSRVESLTDGVFAIAITLLVVSLEVPNTFDQLVNSMKGFLAFGVTLSALIGIWYIHYNFFRRYKLIDGYIIFLNSLMLLVVLFYIYPLKFLATLLVNLGLLKSILGVDIDVNISIEASQIGQLMVVYGIGLLSIFVIFILFHLHAYRKRVELKLNSEQILLTVSRIQGYGITVLISFSSILMILIGGVDMAIWSGWIYALIGPLNWIHGIRTGKLLGKMTT